MTTTTGATAPTTDGPHPTKTRAHTTTVRPRRNLRLVALGLVLATLCALAAAYLANRAGTPVPTLVVKNDVAAGEKITRQDLGVVQLTGANGLDTLRPADADRLVGKRAAGPIPAGSLANPNSVVAALAPRAGDNLVGIGLKPGQMPSSGLRAGDQVRAVVTAGGQAVSGAEPGTSWNAWVMAVGAPDQDGRRTVDLSISTADAPAVAAAAGAGTVSLILVTPVTAG